MLNEYVAPSLVNEQLDLRDSALQASLRQQLSALDVQVTERFQTQPVFHEFVQHHFDQDFADLTPPWIYGTALSSPVKKRQLKVRRYGHCCPA
ncbi:hypothetical protein LZV00_14610 [Pseudomonas kielensis]|uniref:hypothetical protein n=1 Tax=Pseudomonas kielensis TaxID=2762577 RepID=UPI0022402E01|nr:hypothetical protein [Pseudomonas kielensis]UZM11998.1 hypothetical protein LZV00_14610 [Pseudomonas kielensis]